MRVERGELKGVEAEELLKFYLGSRAERTLPTYQSAFRKVWAHASNVESSLFRWGEGEVIGLLIKLEKEQVGENMLKQALAVVNIVFECMGMASPSKGEMVSRIKRTCVKRCNERKQEKGVLRERVGATLEDMRKMVDALYKYPASRIDPARRRCLVLQLLLFFGMKRFSDISGVMKKDVRFLKDHSIQIYMRKSKTDQKHQGAYFFLSGEKYGNMCLPEVLRWYMEGFKMEDDDLLFPRLRGGKEGSVPIRHISVSYSTALKQLKDEVRLLGLSNITLHSGRIGAATCGAEAGVGREHLKACGGWKSGAVDSYIRLPKSGVTFSDKMLKGFVRAKDKARE